ncbi:MAG: hypothetical protein RL885_25055 [Planctomycetota bacterium]
MPDLRFRVHQMETVWNEKTGQAVQINPRAELPAGLTRDKPKNVQAPEKARVIANKPVSTQSADEMATMTIKAIEDLPEWERVADKAAHTTKDAKIQAILKVRAES